MNPSDVSIAGPQSDDDSGFPTARRDSLVEEADERTKQANQRTEEAHLQTTQADLRTDAANDRTRQADEQVEKAESTCDALRDLSERFANSTQPLVPERVFLTGNSGDESGQFGILQTLIGLLVAEKSGLDITAPKGPHPVAPPPSPKADIPPN